MSKLRNEARDRPCMIRVPGICNGDNRTTVLAHMNGGGMGMKHHDMFGAWSCSSCHDYVDGRTNRQAAPAVAKQLLLEGILRTQQILLDEGKIKCG